MPCFLWHDAPCSRRRSCARFVQPTRRVLVAPQIQVVQIVGQTQQEAQLLDAQVGPPQVRPALPGIRRLDEGLQNVQGALLDVVAQQKLLAARKAFHRRYQPHDETVVGFQGRPRLTRPVAEDFVQGFASSVVKSSTFRPGGQAPWTPGGKS